MTNMFADIIALTCNVFKNMLDLIHINIILFNCRYNLFHQSGLKQKHISIFQQHIDVFDNILRRIQTKQRIIRLRLRFSHDNTP